MPENIPHGCLAEKKSNNLVFPDCRWVGFLGKAGRQEKEGR